MLDRLVRLPQFGQFREHFQGRAGLLILILKESSRPIRGCPYLPVDVFEVRVHRDGRIFSVGEAGGHPVAPLHGPPLRGDLRVVGQVPHAQLVPVVDVVHSGQHQLQHRDEFSVGPGSDSGGHTGHVRIPERKKRTVGERLL